MMQEKRWGAFLCDCRSTMKVDSKKIGKTMPLVAVASNPENEIHAFAKEADQLKLEDVIIGCCAEPSIFEEALQGKKLHFLDLKGNCFSPHPDIEKAHSKALKMIHAEIEASKI